MVQERDKYILQKYSEWIEKFNRKPRFSEFSKFSKISERTLRTPAFLQRLNLEGGFDLTGRGAHTISPEGREKGIEQMKKTWAEKSVQFISRPRDYNAPLNFPEETMVYKGERMSVQKAFDLMVKERYSFPITDNNPISHEKFKEVFKNYWSPDKSIRGIKAVITQYANVNNLIGTSPKSSKTKYIQFNDTFLDDMSRASGKNPNSKFRVVTNDRGSGIGVNAPDPNDSSKRITYYSNTKENTQLIKKLNSPLHVLANEHPHYALHKQYADMSSQVKSNVMGDFEKILTKKNFKLISQPGAKAFWDYFEFGHGGVNRHHLQGVRLSPTEGLQIVSAKTNSELGGRIGSIFEEGISLTEQRKRLNNLNSWAKKNNILYEFPEGLSKKLGVNVRIGNPLHWQMIDQGKFTPEFSGKQAQAQLSSKIQNIIN